MTRRPPQLCDEYKVEFTISEHGGMRCALCRMKVDRAVFVRRVLESDPEGMTYDYVCTECASCVVQCAMSGEPVIRYEDAP